MGRLRARLMNILYKILSGINVLLPWHSCLIVRSENRPFLERRSGSIAAPIFPRDYSFAERHRETPTISSPTSYSILFFQRNIANAFSTSCIYSAFQIYISFFVFPRGLARQMHVSIISLRMKTKSLRVKFKLRVHIF